MAISFVNKASAAAATVSLTGLGLAAGDVILVFAYKTTATAPTTAAGFTAIDTRSGNVNSFKLGYKLATGSETDIGTWTNANLVIAHIYRGATLTGSVTGRVGAAATTATIPALGLVNTDNTSWIVAFVGSKQATSESTPAAGVTTLRTTQTGTSVMGIGVDSGGTATSFAQTSSTLGSSVTWGTSSVELLDAKVSTVNTYTTTTTWTSASNQTSAIVRAWGGGGGAPGNASALAGGGGGGGAYAQKLVSVSPSTGYTVTVGAGGAAAGSASAGGDSWFNTSGTVLAKGGSVGTSSGSGTAPGGAGGTTAGSIGDVTFAGGNGGAGDWSASAGGGGGGSAGDAGAGGAGSGATAGAAGVTNGAAGGASTVPGSVPGSGGGGGDSISIAGQVGGGGQITVYGITGVVAISPAKRYVTLQATNRAASF